MVSSLNPLEMKIGLHENVDIRRGAFGFHATYFKYDGNQAVCDALGETICEAIHNLQDHMLGNVQPSTEIWESLEHLETVIQGSKYIHIYYVVTDMAVVIYDDDSGADYGKAQARTIREALALLQRKVA